MNKKVIYSYLRHLVVTAAGIALAVVKVKHIPLLHLTKTDLITIANAVWLAILPQLRFAVQPLVNVYLKKKFPSLGLSIQDFIAASNPATTTAGDTLPAQVASTPANATINYSATPVVVTPPTPVVETSNVSVPVEVAPVVSTTPVINDPQLGQ